MPTQPPPGQPWWDVCNPVYGNNRPSACGGVNLGGHGDPSSPGGYRQDYSIPLTVGNDVLSPVNGIVLPQHSSGYLSLFGRQDWGGETDILTNLPEYGDANPVLVTILHYDSLDGGLKGGAVVSKGQSLGLSGGQTSGGNWPANPKDSTGPHIGVAVRPYNTWHGYKDPTPLLQDLWSNTDKSTYPTVAQLRRNEFLDLTTYEYTASGNNGFQLSNPLDALGGIGTNLGKFVSFVTNGNNWLRLGKIIAGGLLLGIGLIATIFGPAVPDIAAAGVTASGIPEAAPAVQQTLGGRGRRRTFRAAVRTAGAIQGQRTLAERQTRGRIEEERRASQARREAARKGAETRRRERAAGVPPARPRNPERPANAAPLPEWTDVTAPGSSRVIGRQNRRTGQIEFFSTRPASAPKPPPADLGNPPIPEGVARESQRPMTRKERRERKALMKDVTAQAQQYRRNRGV